MRELSVSETVSVSGGTSIYDYRSGDPGSGLPNDPLNTGNMAIDYANAYALLANGEVSPTQLSILRPDIATNIATDIAASMFPGGEEEEGFLDCYADNVGHDIVAGAVVGTALGATVGGVTGTVLGVGVGTGPGIVAGGAVGALVGIGQAFVSTGLSCALRQ